MRQGDGSDLLGPGNPQSADIGIIYVESTDTRPEILKAINTQEITGRKQIAIVLLDHHKAFRQPVDFDGLKNLRRGLKAQLVFIAPAGPGPANFARQRNFPVYSSLDSLKQAILTEGVQPPNSSGRLKSRPGLLPFSSRKAGQKRGASPSAPPMPPAGPQGQPGRGNQPIPQGQPGRGNQPMQQQAPLGRGKPPMQPGPQGPGNYPNQPVRSSQLADLDTVEMNQPDQKGPGAGVEGAAAGAAAGLIAGSLAANSLENDEDALYQPPPPPAGSGLPTPTAQGSSTAGSLAGPARPDSKPLQSGPGIIAFPTNLPATPRTTGKMGAVQNQPATPPRTSRKLPPSQNQPGAQAKGGNVSPVIPEAADLQPGNGHNMPPNGTSPASNTPNQPPARQGGNGGAGLVAGAALGAAAAAALTAGAANAAGTGAGSGAANVGGANAGAANAGTANAIPASVGPNAPTVSNTATGPAGAAPLAGAGAAAGLASSAAGGRGGAGVGLHPSGLTPLPPPRLNNRRRRRWPRSIVLLCLLALLLLTGLLVVAALNAHGVSLNNIINPNITAQITITPDSKLEQDDFLIIGKTSGTADPNQSQVAAQKLTATSPSQSASHNATGSTAATTASGTLTFSSASTKDVTLGSTTLTGNDGVQIRFNGPVFIPSGSASTKVSATAINPGSQGNIAAQDISQNCCAANILVKNLSAFTGGTDAIKDKIITANDISNATNSLVPTLKQEAQAKLQSQVTSEEHVVDSSLNCTNNLTADEKAGNEASSVKVTGTTTCTEEVYNFQNANQIAIKDLQTHATSDIGASANQYALTGTITTGLVNPVSVTSNTGQLSIDMHAQGLWVYQFNPQAQQNLKEALIKHSKKDALTILQHTTGIASAQISLSSGSTMPTTVDKITITIQKLQGPSSTVTPTGTQGTTGTPGTPTSTPSTQPTVPQTGS